MRDNRGMSLVELLLAFAISAIILSGVAYLLFTALGISGRNSANVMVQNEAQTTLNLIVDNIMEAQGICMEIPGADTNTECLLMGDLLIVEDGSGNFDAYYKGMALVTDISSPAGVGADETYLVEVPNATLRNSVAPYAEYSQLAAGLSTEAKAAQAALDRVKEYIGAMDQQDRIMWLLSRYTTECRVEPKRMVPGDADLYQEIIDYGRPEFPPETYYFFKEPFTVHITLSFSYDYGRGVVSRTLEDDAAVRSRIPSIFVKETGADMQKYQREQ